MPGHEGERARAGPRHRGLTRALAAAAALGVLYAGLSKALLFRNLEYWSNDLFQFLELSWSWHYAGRLLNDNTYGDHTAIHTYLLLPLFAPLTIPFGAYGLFLVLVAVNLLAALRAAYSEELDLPGRLAVTAALVGPLGYYVFDNPGTGFHVETCYPALATWLALELVAGRRRMAVLAAGLVLLVKEDGPVLCASLLVAFFAWRLWSLRGGAPEERRRVVKRALASLTLVTLAFVAAMALLHHSGQTIAPEQTTSSSPRVAKSLRILELTLTGEARPPQRERLVEGLVAYGWTVGVLLLPLGRRLPRGLALFLLSAAPLLVVMTISSALYRFELMMWAPRLAPLTALLIACVVFASAVPRSPQTSAITAGLVAVSFGLQIVLLGHMGYRLRPRLDVAALASGKGYVAAKVPRHELAFLRCVAERLPGGLPVSAPADVHGVFHRQSLVLDGLEEMAWHAPRLRVVPTSAVAALPEGFCRGPRVGELEVVAECVLVPLVAECRQDAPGSGG